MDDEPKKKSGSLLKKFMKAALPIAGGILLGIALEPAILNLFHYDPGGVALINSTQDFFTGFYADTGISELFSNMAEWFQPGINAEMAMVSTTDVGTTLAGEDVFIPSFQ